MSFEKHRDERQSYAIDLAARLADGESLTGSPTVRVHDTLDDADVSAEFGSPEGSIDGTRVEFVLDAAQDAAHQANGDYYVYARVQTTDDEILVETPLLRVRIR